MPRPACRLLTLLGLLALAPPALGPLWAGELQVAVAANFSATLDKLAPLFARAGGDSLRLSAGSSGQLATQIEQGAPFDVLLSADAERPQALEKAGLTVPGTRVTYAIGALVLWSPDAGKVDPEGRGLRDGRYARLSLANPATAPYGAAAREVLERLGLWEALNRTQRLVLGENITQAWQFAASGSVDAGFVALSQVIGPDGHISGSSWAPSASLYAPIRQVGVVLRRTPNRTGAQHFLTWLTHDPAALALIHAAGYRTGE